MDPSGPPGSPFRFALIGAGRVGTAVAALLARAGHEVAGVASRSPASATRASSFLGADVFALDGRRPDVNVILIGAPDLAIAGVARDIARDGAEGIVVWHFAGSLGVDPLHAVVDRGGGACALHPVQACPSVDAGLARIPGSAWGMTCSAGLEGWAQRVVRDDLGGVPVPVAEKDRPLWHAASVMTSNGIAAVMAIGEALLSSLGLGAPEEVLGPLAAGTVTNAREGGGGGATLTGPVVRGEAATMARHIDALQRDLPALLPAYLSATRTILAAARAARRIDEGTFTEIVDFLELR